MTALIRFWVLHGVGQVGEEGLVLGQVLPRLPDLVCKLVEIAGDAQVVDLLLQTPPQVLDGVAVGQVAHPLENRNLGVGEPGHDAFGRVTGRPVLHEDGAPCLIPIFKT